MKLYLTVGLSMLAGAALLEAALIPGLVIGGAAVLLPKYLPKLRQRPLSGSTVRRPRSHRQEIAPPAAVPARFGVKQAIAKTIAFRIIVTTLDFTTNYVVIGELAAAAGLSTLNLIVGPVFYLAHETAWNYFGPAEGDVHLSIGKASDDGAGFTVSRAVAKTITFRTIATVIDFTANYVVVRDVATAVGLSAFAVVVGPFVYLGHEKLWDYYGSPRERIPDSPAPVSVVPASA
jgi:uncharacterized membrane protein